MAKFRSKGNIDRFFPTLSCAVSWLKKYTKVRGGRNVTKNAFTSLPMTYGRGMRVLTQLRRRQDQGG